MFAMMIDFRDENGQARRGELVNPFRIMVEAGREVVHVVQENPAEITVMTFDGLTLETHLVPSLAIVNMKEVAIS